MCSTVLWDMLDSDVMEKSIALHFSILRQLAAEHDGYESATEVRPLDSPAPDAAPNNSLSRRTRHPPTAAR